MLSRFFPPSPLMLALLAGAVTLVAFAPFGFWPLQLATLGLVFHLALRETSIARTALLGWAFGFGWTLAGVHWLFITMHHYGHMPAWLAATAVGLLALCVLGPFSALAFAGAAWMRQRWAVADGLFATMLLPATWAISEWMRGWVLTGFPWLVSGYAHNDSLLAGFAPLMGVYGIGLIAAVIGGCLSLLPNRKLPLLLALALCAIGPVLNSIAWTHAQGRPISVRLLQGNVSQETKFNDGRIESSLALYYSMITAAPADLIATPETALPLFIRQLPPDYLPRLSDYAVQTKSHVLIGMFVSDAPQRYANSVIGISPGSASGPGANFYRYDKHHLVPFGEFIPWGFRWFVDSLQIPMADQTRGPVLQGPFQVKDQWIMPNICYEDLFGGEIAGQLAAAYFSGKPQASILLNLSNLAWFDDSVALPQHLQISQMRALESGRPMLRATNTGATAIIDPHGKVLRQLEILSPATLSATVQGYAGNTPYILTGNAGPVGLALFMLATARFFSRKSRQKAQKPSIA